MSVPTYTSQQDSIQTHTPTAIQLWFIPERFNLAIHQSRHPYFKSTNFIDWVGSRCFSNICASWVKRNGWSICYQDVCDEVRKCTSFIASLQKNYQGYQVDYCDYSPFDVVSEAIYFIYSLIEDVRLACRSCHQHVLVLDKFIYHPLRSILYAFPI